MKRNLSWLALGVLLVIGTAAVSTTVSRFKDVALSGSLSLSGKTNTITISTNGTLQVDGEDVVGGGDTVWTNSDGFFYPAGTSLEDDAPISIRTEDGSMWIGKNAWQDVSLDTDPGVTLVSVISEGESEHAGYLFDVLGDLDWGYYSTIAGDLTADPNPGAGSAYSRFDVFGTNNVSFRLLIGLDPSAEFTPKGPISYTVNDADKFVVDTNGTPAVRGVAGITTTWTNVVSGVITQRITAVGGIVVTNLTL